MSWGRINGEFLFSHNKNSCDCTASPALVSTIWHSGKDSKYDIQFNVKRSIKSFLLLSLKGLFIFYFNKLSEHLYLKDDSQNLRSIDMIS